MQITPKLWQSLWLLGFLMMGVACGTQVTETPDLLNQLVDPTVTITPVSTPTLAGNLIKTPLPQAATPLTHVNAQQSIGDPYIPELGNQGYDVQHYTLRFDLDPRVQTVQAHATIYAVAQQDNLAELSLDFIGFQVTSVMVNEVATTFTRDARKLIITLPAPLTAGNFFTLDIHYEGTPPRAASPYIPMAEAVGFNYRPNGSLFAFAEPDGARYWYPSNDHPRDKATFRFELTVPQSLTGVANGILLETIDLPEKTQFIWEHNRPMATYLAVVAVDNYVRIDEEPVNGIIIRHYVRPEQVATFQQVAGINREAIIWMSEQFGPYPFEAYGYVIVDLPNLSMETQTMVLLSNSMIGNNIMIHELAHAWFGDWVSLSSWGEMWRNEGFATYVTAMWENRDDPEGLELEMAGIASAVEGNNRTHSLAYPPHAQLFGFETYYKGAMLVHALRQEVGDEAFFRGLKQYFAQYGGRTASDAEFQAVMEQSAGKPLDAFFNSWLN